MKVRHRANHAERRFRDTHATWTLHAQVEALVDAARGKPQKLDALIAHIAAVEAMHPEPAADEPGSPAKRRGRPR